MQYISKKQARNTGLKLPDEYSCADGCLHISMYSYAYMQQIESILVSTFYICSECVRNSDVAEKTQILLLVVIIVFLIVVVVLFMLIII